MGMGKQRAQAAVKYLGELFPRWKTNAELSILWVELLEGHEEATAKTVLKAHRAQRGGNDPSLKEVGQALAAARSQQRTMDAARQQRPEGRPRCPDGMTFQEAAVWMLENDPPPSQRAREDIERVARGEEPHGEHLRRIVKGERPTFGQSLLPRAETRQPKGRNQSGLIEDSFESLRTE